MGRPYWLELWNYLRSSEAGEVRRLLDCGQALHALLGGRVRAEQAEEPGRAVAAQRIHDRQLRRGGVDRHRDALGVRIEALKRRRQVARFARNARRGCVGLELVLTA